MQNRFQPSPNGEHKSRSQRLIEAQEQEITRLRVLEQEYFLFLKWLCVKSNGSFTIPKEELLNLPDKVVASKIDSVTKTITFRLQDRPQPPTTPLITPA